MSTNELPLLAGEAVAHSRAEDVQLVKEAVAGERAAFDRLMRKHQRQVFRTAYRLLGVYDQADEVAQEVFVRAFRSLHTFRHDAALTTWLYTITVNVSRNRIRQNMRRRRRLVSLSCENEAGGHVGECRDIPDFARVPDAVIMRQELAARVQQAIGELDALHRAVIVLRDVEGLPYEEIAHILRLNIGTVKSRLYRARQLLQLRLQEAFS
ncbi:MAG: sigma-70 family RNA polymerase sigma factor [Candidatus Omnitrophica bacterium]|nr:sigma-70 family RNA polymerase sigma factor [Candidatus Omnitrophota bacterium]